MNEQLDDRAKEEICALEAILLNDIQICASNDSNYPVKIVTKIVPSTAHNTQLQYVCLTLEVLLSNKYPDEKPIIFVKNPRGLDDFFLRKIHDAITQKLEEYLGQAVIFDVIELIRDNLTQSNVPKCQCAICLFGFVNGDNFTKTDCFHYFHSFCLNIYVTNSIKYFNEEQESLPIWQRDTSPFQAKCPVCREVLEHVNLKVLENTPEPFELKNALNFELTPELKSLQDKMSSLYLYQKKRGGIIDAEVEKNRGIIISNVTSDCQNDNSNISDYSSASTSVPICNNLKTTTIINNKSKTQHKKHLKFVPSKKSKRRFYRS